MMCSRPVYIRHFHPMSLHRLKCQNCLEFYDVETRLPHVHRYCPKCKEIVHKRKHNEWIKAHPIERRDIVHRYNQKKWAGHVEEKAANAVIFKLVIDPTGMWVGFPSFPEGELRRNAKHGMYDPGIEFQQIPNGMRLRINNKRKLEVVL